MRDARMRVLRPGQHIMPTRGFTGSFIGAVAAIGCYSVLGSACRSVPGGPVLPRPDSTSAAQEIAGGVSKVESDKLMENSPRTVTDMLVGRFPGVEVYKTKNGGTSIKIR